MIAFLTFAVLAAAALTAFALDHSPAHDEQDGQAHGDCFPFVPTDESPFHSQTINSSEG